MRMLDLIAGKRQKRAHTPEELRFIAEAAANGTVPDYQLSAWLMAVCLNGMSEPETVALTRAMAVSGDRLALESLKSPKVDKHSTGGVGDGISIALAPLLAAAGCVVPMMSGRGLGHTGGTLDKLEALKGFKVRLSMPEIDKELRELGVSMFGQTERLAPADRKLYQLRDATSTVESLPLVVSSILSKKVAEDLDALVLDVKVGRGAIFQKPADAEKLARALVKTAKGLGLRCVALMTAMDQPLGRYVGNALEIRQAVEILRGDFAAADYAEVLLSLGGWMAHLAGKAKSPEDGQRTLEGLIASGAALDRLKKMVRAQGGDAAMIDDLSLLPQARLCRAVPSPRDGFLSRLDARIVGEAAVRLGAGRATMEDRLDYGAGMVLDKKVGDPVKRGETLAHLFADSEARLEAGLSHFMTSFDVAPRAPKNKPVILKTLK
jgi:pyrimidine-nucleoside phosphorylase